MRHYVTGPPGRETKIKFLRGATIFCQWACCDREATHLFRRGTGQIAAYCELHVKLEADRSGADLPIDRYRLLHTGS